MKIQLKDLISNLKEKEEALSKSEETLDVVKKRMLKDKNDKYENKLLNRYNDLKLYRLEESKKDMDEFKKSDKSDLSDKYIMEIRFLEDILKNILKEEKYLEFSKKILNNFEKNIRTTTENLFRTEKILIIQKEELKKIQIENEKKSKLKEDKLQDKELKQIETNIKQLSSSIKDYSENFENQFFEFLKNEKEELYKSLSEISDYTYKSLITNENDIKLPFSTFTKIKNWFEENFQNENTPKKIMNLEKEYKMFYINNKSKYEKKNENIVSSIKKLNINYNINDIEVNTSTEDLLKEPQLFYKSMLWISLNHQTFAHNSKVNENMNKNLIELKEKYSKTKQELKEDIQSNENDLQKEYKKQREIEQIEGEIKEYRRKLSANKFVDSLLSDLKDEVKNELLNDKELLNDTNEISKISEKLKELKNTKNKLTYKISTLQSKVRIYGNKDIEINNNFNNYYKTDYNRQINDNTNDLIMLMFLLDSYDKENSEHLKYIDSGIDSTFSNSYDDNSTHNHHSSSDFDYSNSSFNDWTSSNYGESSYSSDSGSSYSSDSGSSYSSDSGSSYSSDSGSSYSSD